MVITIQGQEVSVRELDFEISREYWNEYKLLDGGRVKVRCIVLRIYQVLDEEGRLKRNPEGTPMLVVSSEIKVIS